MPIHPNTPTWVVVCLQFYFFGLAAVTLYINAYGWPAFFQSYIP